jgi:hypothetical protein
VPCLQVKQIYRPQLKQVDISDFYCHPISVRIHLETIILV